MIFFAVDLIFTNRCRESAADSINNTANKLFHIKTFILEILSNKIIYTEQNQFFFNFQNFRKKQGFSLVEKSTSRKYRIIAIDLLFQSLRFKR